MSAATTASCTAFRASDGRELLATCRAPLRESFQAHGSRITHTVTTWTARRTSPTRRSARATLGELCWFRPWRGRARRVRARRDRSEHLLRSQCRANRAVGVHFHQMIPISATLRPAGDREARERPAGARSSATATTTRVPASPDLHRGSVHRRRGQQADDRRRLRRHTQRHRSGSSPSTATATTPRIPSTRAI